MDDFSRQPADALSRKLGEKIEAVPWPVREAIEQAASAPRLVRRETRFVDLARELSEQVLGGRVELGPEGDWRFRPQDTEEVRLDFHASSTVVKSLASLVFYLEHAVSEGDVLVIDEPELNLHPDNQRRIARFLVRLVHHGFRLIVTTHSDLLLRELSHCIILAGLEARGRELAAELGYDEEELLPAERIGVHLCAGGTVHPIPVTAEGFDIETIDEVIHGLSNVGQLLHAALLERGAPDGEG